MSDDMPTRRAQEREALLDTLRALSFMTSTVYIVDVDADGRETSRRSYVNGTNRREATTAALSHAQGVSCESYDDALRNAREALAWSRGYEQGQREAFGLSGGPDPSEYAD